VSKDQKIFYFHYSQIHYNYITKKYYETHTSPPNTCLPLTHARQSRSPERLSNTKRLWSNKYRYTSYHV